jgi:hypothetical protein
MAGIVLAPGAGLKAFGSEGASQIATNPAAPNIGSDPNQDARYNKMSGWDRFVSVNQDAAKSVGASVNEFVHHPIKSAVPAIKAGATSTVQPILHPVQTVQGIKDYFVKKGPIDGVSQVAFTAANVGTVGAIALGLGAMGTALVADRFGGAALAAKALAIGGKSFKAIGIMSLGSLAFNAGQLVYDEAQAAAPEKGALIPKWVPLLGGKSFFKKTSHQEQTNLVKFDVLNVGGSLLTYGIAGLHEHMNAPRVAGAPAPSPLKKVLGSSPVAYGAMGASFGGLLVAQTPTN